MKDRTLEIGIIGVNIGTGSLGIFYRGIIKGRSMRACLHATHRQAGR